ncbi:MAG TPA: hypothetical protein VFK59_01900 [Actinomycetota bacterium]|nr:hypothetical protein [Actinomycetota bacterium]
MRTRAVLVPVLLGLVACSPELAGPAAPIAAAQVTPGPALDASAARGAVVSFVEAYRAAPEQGVLPLAGLVAGQELGAWVRWLDVQHREFDGTIEAAADVRDVEFVGTVEARRATAAQVGLSASVTFVFDPTDDDPIELVRVLDGPVTLIRTDLGAYRVVDLSRNGVPMSDGIEVFRDEELTQGGVTVRLDSLFMFPPNWQFNVVVTNDAGEDILLDPSGAALFVDADEGFERVDGVITPSLDVVPAGGSVEGLMVFPAQDSARGRVLSLVYGTGQEALRFEFPLDDLVTVVPPPPPEETA